VEYEFLRPGDGQALDENFQPVTVSAWTGTLRSGLRLIATEAVLLEAGMAYLSLGESDLDIWKGKVYLSFRF